MSFFCCGHCKQSLGGSISRWSADPLKHIVREKITDQLAKVSVRILVDKEDLRLIVKLLRNIDANLNVIGSGPLSQASPACRGLGGYSV